MSTAGPGGVRRQGGEVASGPPERLRLVYDARQPPRPSGVGLYTQELLEALARRAALEITAIAAPGQPLPPGVARLSTEVPFDRHGRAQFFEHVQLPALLQERGIEIVHGPNSIIPLGRSAAARVVTLHDAAFARFPQTLTPRFRLLMRIRSAASLAAADAAIAVSRFTAQELASLFPRHANKVVAIPSGTPESARRHVRNAPRAASLLKPLGLEPGRYVCAIGTLEPRKNLMTLLEAFKHAAVPGLKLALVGDRGWREGPLRRALRVMPSGAVVITGWIPGEEMRDLIAESSGLLFPSIYEGFGFPPLEALALGVPTACADLPPVAESCGGRALLVAPLDVKAWARAIWLLSEMPRPPPWSSRTFDDVARETEELYRVVLGRRSATARAVRVATT